MKPSDRKVIFEAGYVAPHAGAWIETWSWQDIHIRESVAPHAGAWIETVPVFVKIKK